MKNFKAMNKDVKGFEYLKEKFPKISDGKVKEGMFIELRIREIISDDLLGHLLMETKKSVWRTFV
jgi:hypothetical protein